MTPLLVLVFAVASSNADTSHTKSKRQIFREQLVPHAGGRIPDGAFRSDRLALNRLNKEGIAVPDGILLEARHRESHFGSHRHDPDIQASIIKLVQRPDGRYAPPEGRYPFNDIVESTYIIRPPINTPVILVPPHRPITATLRLPARPFFHNSNDDALDEIDSSIDFFNGFGHLPTPIWTTFAAPIQEVPNRILRQAKHQPLVEDFIAQNTNLASRVLGQSVPSNHRAHDGHNQEGGSPVSSHQQYSHQPNGQRDILYSQQSPAQLNHPTPNTNQPYLTAQIQPVLQNRNVQQVNLQSQAPYYGFAQTNANSLSRDGSQQKLYSQNVSPSSRGFVQNANAINREEQKYYSQDAEVESQTSSGFVQNSDDLQQNFYPQGIQYQDNSLPKNQDYSNSRVQFPDQSQDYSDESAHQYQGQQGIVQSQDRVPQNHKPAPQKSQTIKVVPSEQFSLPGQESFTQPGHKPFETEYLQSQEYPPRPHADNGPHHEEVRIPGGAPIGDINHVLQGLEPREVVSKISASVSIEHEYPGLTTIPETDFTCTGPSNHMQPDPSTSCQVFHLCNADGSKESFLCPKGSRYDDTKQQCASWTEVTCVR